MTTTIAIIGSGNVGRAIGRGLSTAGHTVVFGVRDTSDERHADLDSVATREEAVAGAEVVILAVPADAAADTVAALELGVEHVLVDATNAVGRPVPDGHATMADLVAAHATPGTSVVKAFNTIGFEHMDTGTIDGRPAFLPIAGDEAGTDVVAPLASSIGFDVVVLGERDYFGLMEAHAQLWIRLAFGVGWGRGFGFSVVGR